MVERERKSSEEEATIEEDVLQARGRLSGGRNL
jgi:hypothetical protein